MISMKNAAEIIRENYSGTNPSTVCDYNNKMYIVEAPRISDEPDFSNPFYYVTKDGKDHGVFNPMDDLDGFLKSSEKFYNVR